MNILLPVDGSPSSSRAVRYVIRHWGVESTPRAALLLLHVDPALSQGVTRYLTDQDVARFHADNSKLALRSARRALHRAGLLFEEIHKVGDPAAVIVSTATRTRCDLIAMGSHGWGALLSFVLGSVVVKVLAHSRAPVLVIR